MFDKDFVSQLLQTVILAAIPVVVPIMVSIAIAYWRKVKAEIQEKAPVAYEALKVAARIAVQAAEQLAMTGVIQEKKRYAIDRVKLLLEGQGITMDIESISAAIEAAVLEQFNSHKLNAKQVTK